MERKILRANIIYSLFIHAHYLGGFWLLRVMENIFNVDPELINWLMIALVARFAYKVLYFYSHRYEFTDDQLIISKGVFSRTENYIEFYRIKDFRKYQSLLMRIFNVMNITVVSSDKINRITDMKGINNSNILRELRIVVNDSRKVNRVYEVD